MSAIVFSEEKLENKDSNDGTITCGSVHSGH